MSAPRSPESGGPAAPLVPPAGVAAILAQIDAGETVSGGAAAEPAEDRDIEADYAGDLDEADLPPPVDDGGSPPAGDGVDQDVVRACSGLDQNDTDNGRRLLNHFGGDVLHVREVGWHAWTGSHWRLEGGQEAIERAAQETARRIKLEPLHFQMAAEDKRLVAAAEKLRDVADDDLTDEQRTVLQRADEAEARLAKRRSDRRKFAISSGNRARTVAMISQALPHCTVEPAAMDADPMLFNVANGTLRFSRRIAEVPDPECPDPDVVRLVRTVTVGVELVPHDRAHRLAKLVTTPWQPHARCPAFFRFLRRIQPDRAMRRYLMTALGRALLGGASTQMLMFWWGDGANGKSLLQEVIAHLLGDYAGRLKPEALAGNTEVGSDRASPEFARLAGKRFLVIEELPRGAPLKEALIKTVTGGTPFPVRHLNKGLFDLVPEFFPVMTGNELPSIGGLDHGIWRRMRFVEFGVTIPKDEQKPLPEMVQELLGEAPGILRWLVAGACAFLRDGLRDPESVTRLTASHREELDPVGAFVTNCVRPLTGHRVQAREMYLGFKSFCEVNAIRHWSEPNFSKAMKKKGFIREDKRLRYWLDVDLDAPQVAAPRSPDSEDAYGAPAH